MDAKKKSVQASERDAIKRALWRQLIATQEAGDLVFVDECGANLAMTPRFARAPQGQRAVGQAPFVRGQNNTLIGALSVAGITAALTLSGAADAGAFIFFVREMLVPTLRPGQIVVLDNARIHQDSEVQEILESRGCYLLPLPAYSPDFSPIENAWSKLKEFLRRAQARTQEALDAAFTAALQAITAQDAVGWFLHCGYKL
jgi:transposase